MRPFNSFLAAQLTNYVAYRRSLGYSAKPLNTHLKAFDQYLAQRKKEPVELPPSFFLEMRADLDMESRSVNRVLSSIRMFFGFLVRCGHYEINPVKDIPLLPENEIIPFIFSEKQVDQLLLAVCKTIRKNSANKLKCRTLFATHYHELTELGQLLVNVKNLNVAVREWGGQVVFLHKIIPGGTDKSYGIHVAKLAGIPKTILSRSDEILKELENTFAKEASGEHLAKHKTASDEELLFVEKHKSVLDKLKDLEVNNLTPIEAINLLNKIKKEMEEN